MFALFISEGVSCLIECIRTWDLFVPRQCTSHLLCLTFNDTLGEVVIRGRVARLLRSVQSFPFNGFKGK